MLYVLGEADAGRGSIVTAEAYQFWCRTQPKTCRCAFALTTIDIAWRRKDMSTDGQLKARAIHYSPRNRILTKLVETRRNCQPFGSNPLVDRRPAEPASTSSWRISPQLGARLDGGGYLAVSLIRKWCREYALQLRRISSRTTPMATTIISSASMLTRARLQVSYK